MLEKFSWLIGGKWYFEDTWQTFNWGLAKMSVRLESFTLINGEAHLLAEGWWYWHPGEQNVKGFFTAIDQDVTFFDCRTEFEGDKIISHIQSFTENSKKQNYVEFIEPAGKNKYIWKFLEKSEVRLKENLRCVFIRR